VYSFKAFFIFYKNYLNFCRSISCRSNGLSAIFVSQKAVGQTACRSNGLPAIFVGQKAVGQTACRSNGLSVKRLSVEWLSVKWLSVKRL
jgi:hypothetical protein